MTPSLPTHESRAEQVLKCLRGYVTRQTWVPEDREIIASILREWADEVDGLERRVKGLESELATLRSQVSVHGRAISVGYKFATDSHRAS